MGIASLSPTCSPPLPPAAKPMSCMPVRNRFVRREEATIKTGSPSLKPLGQRVGLRQTDRAIVSNYRIERPSQGKSLGCVRYELWMADEGLEQRGQGAVSRYEVKVLLPQARLFAQSLP